jgi:hypothetical protein
MRYRAATVRERFLPQAARPVSWKGKSGNYAIECSKVGLKVTRADTGKPVFDAGADAKAAWTVMVRNAKGAPMEAQFTYRVLSAIGPYLSLEEVDYCDCGGAHPTAVKRFRAIDLGHAAHSSPASLPAIFSERTVFTALLADPAVAKALPPPKPESLKQLLATLRDLTLKVKDCEYGFNDDLLSSFAFYDASDGHVSVRLGLPSAEEVCRGQMTQLGLSLSVPEALGAAILEAKQQRGGLLMLNSTAPTATFRFSQKQR